MYNRIKRILTFFILFFAVMIAVNVARAADSSYTYRPNNVSYLVSDGITTAENTSSLLPQRDSAGNWIFCRETGGPIRFTRNPPEFIPEKNSDGTYGWYRAEYKFFSTNPETSVAERAWQRANRAIKEAVETALEECKESLGEPVNITRYKYNNGRIVTSYDYIVCDTPVYRPFGAPKIYKNNAIAYILSATVSPTDIYDNVGNYGGTYFTNDVWLNWRRQINLWHIQDWNKGWDNYGKDYSLPDVIEAAAYENYHNTYVAPGYKNFVKFEETNPKVIALRDEQAYIIGPYVLTYPDESQFSYISDIFLVDEHGNEIMARPEIIKTNMTRPYPSTGEQFYIKVKAADINYAQSIEMRVNFMYIKSTIATVQVLQGEGTVRHYKVEYDDVFIEYENEGTEREKEVWERRSRAELVHTPGDSYISQEFGRVEDGGNDEYDDDGGENKVVTDEEGYEIGFWREFSISSKMKTITETSYKSDIGAYRNWRFYNIGTMIDLKFDLKGMVFEDSMGGKESLPNGLYSEGDGDRKVPHVPVTLYEQNTSTGTTRVYGTYVTDDEGNYEFLNLNPMFKYYVEFTYNGMYYEPTLYKAGASFPYDDISTWSINSKATDVPSERESFNDRFRSIGSSPHNYAGGRTFSKKTLQGYTLQASGNYEKTSTEVIDDWGNLINSGVSSEMTTYVNNCLMKAYTGLNGTMDYYNIDERMVLDSVPYVDMAILRETFNPINDGNLYVNFGIYKRPDVDLALRKDVYTATVEINGKTHTYNYDERAVTDESTNSVDGLQNSNTYWDINIRLSDIGGEKYYDKTYSRELYKSDYEYKVSMYGENYADYGKVKGNGVNVPDDELNVYVTWKLTVRNQSLSVTARVDEIVDYYDEDLDYVDNRSYIQIGRRSTSRMSVKASESSIYDGETGTHTTIDGYKNLYIQGLNNTFLESGQTAYIYLTFRIKKDLESDGENWIRLDATNTGKENIAEINGYSTRYASGTEVPNIGDVGGTTAGLVDLDSNPGNLDPNAVPKDGPIAYETFEDDTDKAPNLRLTLYLDDESNRVISGVVWEDTRDKRVDIATVADGIRQPEEQKIDGVTVQLVELIEMQDGGSYKTKEYVWKEFGADIGERSYGPNTIGKGTGTGTKKIEKPIINTLGLVEDFDFGDDYKGAYVFKSFMPGNYVIRFIYGDTVRTVLTNDVNAEVNGIVEQTGLNAKSYNGQDYKSTTYQEGLDGTSSYDWREASTYVYDANNVPSKQEGDIIQTITEYDKENCDQNESATYFYDIAHSDTKQDISDAKDIYSNGTIQNANDMQQTDSSLKTRTEVRDYSETINNHIAEVLSSHRDVPTYSGEPYSKDSMNDLLEELINETKMTAETGLINIEFEYNREETEDKTNKTPSYIIKNVDLGLEERPKQQLEIEKQITNVKVTLSDESVLFDTGDRATNVLWQKHRNYNVGYDSNNLLNEGLLNSIEQIRRDNSSKFGVVQLSMDEELMHGATIEIKYIIMVRNIGEADFDTTKFYYTGSISQEDIRNNIVKTRVNRVLDYVPNNLQFYVDDNDGWSEIGKDELISGGIVNSNLEALIGEHNTIITTGDFGTIELAPAVYYNRYNDKIDRITKELVLTQIVSPENERDDLTYRNILEIANISNVMGRRNEYSAVGNQDPTLLPQELDSDEAETVRILPPFGATTTYYTLWIAIAIVLVAGISFIVFKVLGKKNKKQTF